MDALELIRLIQAVSQLSQSVANIVSQAQGVMSSQDKEAIAQALNVLQDKNDQLHKDVQARLRA